MAENTSKRMNGTSIIVTTFKFCSKFEASQAFMVVQRLTFG